MDDRPRRNRVMKPTSNRVGRPTNADLEDNPPIPVEAHVVPQPPVLGVKNPPCCRTAMVPVERKSLGNGRYRCKCGKCGVRLIITYDNTGNPVLARKL